jgi:hypothetical protein
MLLGGDATASLRRLGASGRYRASAILARISCKRIDGSQRDRGVHCFCWRHRYRHCNSGFAEPLLAIASKSSGLSARKVSEDLPGYLHLPDGAVAAIKNIGRLPALKLGEERARARGVRVEWPSIACVWCCGSSSGSGGLNARCLLGALERNQPFTWMFGKA